MCATPPGYKPQKVQGQLNDILNVMSVHDLHIWAVSPKRINMSAHLVVENGSNHSQVLRAAQALGNRLGCHHTVFQVEDHREFRCITKSYLT